MDIFYFFAVPNPTAALGGGYNSEMGTGQGNPFGKEPVDPTHLQAEAHAEANVQTTSRTTTTSLDNPFELF